eukprot:TRINITY_DN6065_c0_g2_i1.p1 TRINITY_DN6065_c0_g2~~TRINITY_DN6065_c0_g2_i1.p1  ORF type:complete len:2680 (+),score=518.04 TRINITY_DN6065_c0_g2_i1:223-8262(+)
MEEGAAGNTIRHMFVVLAMTAACMIGPSYTSCCYFLLLFVHSLVHEVQVVNDSGKAEIGPYPALVGTALVVAVVKCCAVATANIYYASDTTNSFNDWYSNHTSLMEGFGIWIYESPLGTFDRFLRHLLPSVVLVVASVVQIFGKQKFPSVCSTRIIFAKLSPSGEPLLPQKKRSAINSLILPLVTILSGVVAVLWPRVLTIPYLLVFLGTTAAWGLSARKAKFSPQTRRIVLAVMFVSTAISLCIQFVTQQYFFKTFYEDNTSTLLWIGVLRLEEFKDIAQTSSGREYSGHILVLPMIFYITWKGYFQICLKASKVLLEDTFHAYLEEHGMDRDSDEEETVGVQIPSPQPERMSSSSYTAMKTMRDGMVGEGDPVGRSLTEPLPEERMSTSSYMVMNTMRDEGDMENATESCEQEETAAAESTANAADVYTNTDGERLAADVQGSSDNRIILQVSNNSEGGTELVSLSSQATYGNTAAETQTTKTVRYFMSKYSPHLLGLVLGLTALVDPSFLSAIWLIMLFLFMWCVLILENVTPIVSTLPFALVWSALHVCAIFVAAIPSVLDYGDDTMDKLDAIGITRHDGSDTAALGAHASLILLIAIVMRASGLVTATEHQPKSTELRSATLLRKIKDILLAKAQYVSLLILVIVGCLHVDLLQASLLVFFVVFASSPSTAKKYWGVLVAYEILLTIFLYLYNVAEKGFSAPDKLGSLDWSTLVEGAFGSMWELTPFLVMVFFSIWQLKLFKESDDVREDSTEETPLFILFKSGASLLLTWIALIAIIMFATPSIMTAGYLVLFLWVSAVTAFGGGARSGSLAIIWVIALCYSTACFLTSYLFQFNGLATLFSEAVNTIMSCDDGSQNTTTICVRQVGFKTYDGVFSRVINLFPHWAVAAVVIMQASYLKKAWMLPAEAINDASPKGTLQKKASYYYMRVKRFLILTSPVLILVALWIASSDSMSLNAVGYFVMMIVTMVTGRVNSLLLVSYSSMVLILKFWYQYKFFPSFMSRDSYRYFGLERIGTVWECNAAQNDMERCLFMDECTWSHTNNTCLPPSSDPSLSSKIWIDVLVLVTAMLCRRVRLWAFNDSPEGLSINAYLREMTIFEHKDDESDAPDKSPASVRGTPALEVTDGEDEFKDITPEQLKLIVKVQSRWRVYLVQKRLSEATTVTAKDGNTLSIPTGTIEAIMEAEYVGEEGSVDVTKLVKSRMDEGGLSMRVSDPELEITEFLGLKKVLKVSYVPAVVKPKSSVMEVVLSMKNKSQELAGEAKPYIIRFIKWAAEQFCWFVDFGFLRWSYELTMLCLLITCAARPRIIKSLVYFSVVIVMRYFGRRGGLWISICIVWVISMYCIQQFFFVGMPKGSEWGPFKDKNSIGDTWKEYWYYFGAFPDRWDLFASFCCSVFIMYHFRYNKRFEEVNENYDIYKCETLTEFLSQKVEGGISRRAKLLELRGSPEFTMERLESLLPTPKGNDFIRKPKTVPERLHGYWLKYLPFLCLTLVFIDGTTAEFITVIRMGKLALAMYLFGVWEVMEWRGNAMWKHINDYFFFALVVHLIWNIPWLADRWEHSDAISKVYTFTGIMDCDNNQYQSSDKCQGSLIQVNAFEIIIMSLLYLQRLNYDKFEHVFVIHQSHQNDINARDVKSLIDSKLRQRREAGLQKTREMVEERHRILERTKQELQGRKGGRRANGMFPPPKFRDDPKLKPRERALRKRLRDAALKGFTAGKKNEFPDSLINDNDDDGDMVRQLRRAFELGQSASVEVPPQYLKHATEYVAGLLEGPFKADEIEAKTPEKEAFVAGKQAAASFMPKEASIATVMATVGAVAAMSAGAKAETTNLMKVVMFFHRNTLLGKADLTPTEIRRKPWAYLFDGMLLYFKENSDKLCFFVFTLNFTISVSILDIVPPASVYLYALLIMPRPPARYWEVMLIFMQFLLALKCVVQALEVTFDDEMPTAFSNFYGSLGKSSFFTNVLGDFIAIVSIIIRQSVLRSWGIYREPKTNTSTAPEHSPLKRRASVSSIRSTSTVTRITAAREVSKLKEEQMLEQHGKKEPGNETVEKIKTWVLRFIKVYEKVLSEEDKIGRTKDYYIVAFSIDLISFLVFIAVYSKVSTEKDFDLGDSIAQNLLPGALVLGVIICVMTMVVDRVLYLYGSLKGKFAMQVALTMGYLWGFFIWFQDSNSSSNSSHTAGAFLFLTRALWLFVAAKQIERGYPIVRRHDCFTDSSDSKIFLVYQVCRAVPFLWEMRVLLDWCCSKTTLKLNYWLKLEDVRNEMLVRKMDIEDSKVTNPKPATSFPAAKKITSGWLLIIVMLFLIFFPLLYYSTFSPALQTNSIKQLRVELGFEGSPPFYQNDLLTVEGSKNSTLASQLSRTRNSVDKQSVTASTKNLQLLQFTSFSSQRWLITDPATSDLAEKFRNSSSNPGMVPNLVTSIEVQRTAGAQADLNIKEYLRYTVNGTNQTMMNGLVDLLLWDGNGSMPAPVYFPKLITPLMLNKPSSLSFLQSASDCYLSVERSSGSNPDGASKYFEVYCRGLFSCGNYPGPAEEGCLSGDTRCPNYDVDPLDPCTTGSGLVPLYYVAISDLAQNDDNPLAGLFNVGIVALYVTFVLAIGRVIRGIISGSAAAVVIQDMEDPSFIARMADHVHLARGEGNFRLEEELYYHLINLLRSPEKVLSITGLRAPPRG